MCYNYKVSLLTFMIGIITSKNLIENGNPKYINENIVSGTFLYFIAGIQLMDFLFWIDLENKLGINHIITLLGPIFNVGQPLILFIIKLIYFKPEKINKFVGGINFIYLIYLIKMYINFISSNELVTSVKYNHLKWPWLKYSNPYFYLILFTINIFYLTNFKYSLILFLVILFLLFLSNKYFSYNIGELWCFFGNIIPIIIFIISYFI
jgi:hypothetical protein